MSLRVIGLADNVGIATTQVVVNNVAPVANAGADQTVDEGDLVTLNGTFTDQGTDDGHKQVWSVLASNGEVVPGLTIDNLAGDSNGAGASSFGFTPGDNGTYTVTYTVTDDDGGVHFDTAVITVNNVAPQASITGPQEGVRGEPLIYILEAMDVLVDAASFDFTIDWNDGTPIQMVSGPSGTTVEHIFIAISQPNPY